MACLYYSFFYGTVCHVCKIRADDKNKKLKRCGGCKMVLYCSPQHQKIHWPLHKRLCKCIKSIIIDKQCQNLFQEASKEWLTEDWCKIRSNSMLLVQLKMECKLSQAEQQMFMFPRVCEVCREVDHDRLLECQQCYCVSYCSPVHQELDLARHSTSCSWLNLCFQLDNHFLKEKDPYSNFNLSFPDQYEALPCSIDSFVHRVKYSDDTLKWNKNIKIALISELLTCPLTIVYALEKLKIKPKKNSVIHVIGAGAFECTFLHKWEILLHSLPQLSCLTIVFIGPEIERNFTECCVLCVKCQEKDRKLRTHFQCGKLYHQYATSAEFETPDILVSFNCGLHEYEGSENDTWSLSIPYLVKFNQTPLILTSYTNYEAQKDVARIMKCTQLPISVYLRCEKNPFGSKRPYRDWDKGYSEVFFQNNFITVVKPNDGSEVPTAYLV